MSFISIKKHKKQILFLFLVASGFLSNSLYIFGIQGINRLFSILFITGTLCWTNCKIHKNNFYIYLIILIVNFSIVISNGFSKENTYLITAILGGIYKLLELFCILSYVNDLTKKDIPKLVNIYLSFFYIVSLPTFLFYLMCQFRLYTDFIPRYIVYPSEIQTLRFGSLSGEPSFYIFFCIIAWYFIEIKKSGWIERIFVILLVYSTYSTLGYLLFGVYYIVKYNKIFWITVPVLLMALINGIQFARLNINLDQLIYFIININSIDKSFVAHNSILGRLYPTITVLNDISNNPWGYGLLGYKAFQTENFENIKIGAPGILQLIRDIGLLGFSLSAILFLIELKNKINLLLILCVTFISLQDTYLLTIAWFFIVSHKIWNDYKSSNETTTFVKIL